MTTKEYIEFANALKNNYTIDFDKLPEFCDMAISALSENKGEWIPIDDFPHEVWECDHCKFVIDGSGCIEPTEYRDMYNFCPNCGADMRGVSE